ncbi:MAG: CinA family protein [Dehalococcoidia bacterium]|nr:CinA family protein [Dehalococcoidia bacterium]
MKKLEVDIAELIRKYQSKTGKFLTVGTAESATGGRIADRLVDIPGSSDYFEGSIVSYSNEVKVDVLGVREEIIRNYGAVSSQTAIEMAQGGKRLLGVDICVAVTGIAGPSGAALGKPVGLFYIGMSTAHEDLSKEYIFRRDRWGNKQDASEAALNMLRQYLLKCIGKLENS